MMWFRSFLRKIILPVFFGLGVLLVFYPTHYDFHYSSVEAFGVLYSPMAFLLLYSLWVASFIGVVLETNQRQPSFSGGFIVTVFSSVSSLMLTNISHLGFDHNYDVTYSLVSYLGSLNHIPSSLPAAYSYLSYPGLFILTYSSSSIIGVPVTTIGPVLQTGIFALVGLCIYGLTVRLLGNQYALLAVPLFFSASFTALAMRLFFPLTFGLALFGLALLLVLGSDRSGLIFVFLTISLVVTHIYPPIALLFLLMFVAGIRRIKGRKARLARLIPVIVITDGLYFFYSTTTFSVNVTNAIISSLFHGLAYNYPSHVVSANLRGYPLWIPLTQYSDLIITVIAGIVLSLLVIVKEHQANDLTWKYSGSTLGLSVFGLTVFIASFSNGAQDFLPFLEFVSFVSIPLLVKYVASKIQLIPIFLIFLVVFCPLALVAIQLSQISTISISPAQVAGVSFLTGRIGTTGEGVITDDSTGGVLATFNPHLAISYFPSPIHQLDYAPGHYNVVYTPFDRYQFHDVGYGYTLIILGEGDVVYSNGLLYLLPPSTN